MGLGFVNGKLCRGFIVLLSGGSFRGKTPFGEVGFLAYRLPRRSNANPSPAG